jgi:hypothetical protein
MSAPNPHNIKRSNLTSIVEESEQLATSRRAGSAEPGPPKQRCRKSQRKSMESATFRKWLAEHGCGFDPHQEKRGTGQVNVTVQS